MLTLERYLSNFIAEKTICLISGDESKKAILAYGYELIITSCFGVFLLIICSVVSGIPAGWISFLLGFAPLRTVAGGYHASTHTRCYIATTSVYCLCILIVKQVEVMYYHLLTASVIVAAIVFLLSPVAARNKPLSEKKRIKNRRLSLIFTLALMLFSVILCLISYSDYYITLLFLGAIAASGSLVAAKIIDYFRKE